MFCRRNIILDIDQTLLHSVNLEDIPKDKNNITQFADLNFHRLAFSQNKRIYQMVVFERPGLQSFLDYVFENFNVGVLTYGSDAYARTIAKEIIAPVNKPERKLSFLFSYGYHDASHSYVDEQGNELFPGWKNLDYLFKRIKPLNFYTCNTIIIDDNIKVTQNNKRNSIRVVPFYVMIQQQGSSKKVVNPNAAHDNQLFVLMHQLIYYENSYPLFCSIDTNFSGCVDNDVPIFDNPVSYV